MSTSINSTDKEEKRGNIRPKYSLSHYFPRFIQLLLPIILLCTIGVLIFSNLHDAEYVQIQIRPTINTSNYTSIVSLYQSELEKLSLIHPFLKPSIQRLSSSAKFDPNVHIPDEIDQEIFAITIVSSIDDFWQSEAYELAIIIAAASLIWPYVKLLILLTVWLKPMHQNRRTKVILFLDQMGKWSYMDLYASIIITVYFYVHATFYLNDLSLDVKIICQPDWGIITFVTVNIISMLYSTTFIFFDQHYGYPHHVQLVVASQYILKKEQRQKQRQKKKQKKKKALIGGISPDLSTVRETSAKLYANAHKAGYNYRASDDEDDDAMWKSDIGLPMHSDISVPQYKLTGIYKSFVRAEIHLWRENIKYQTLAGLYQPQSLIGIFFFSLFLCGLLLCLWLIVDTMYSCPAQFVIDGVVGFVISPDNVRCYNPIETAKQLISSTDAYAFAMFLQVCYIITIIVFPILTQFVLIMLWILPMKHKVFVFLLKSLWFVMAWNAFDVFFVGTAAGALQIDIVSAWIIDTQIPQVCGEDGIFENCFIVNGSITRGCYMAGAAALYQWISMYFTLTLAKDIGVHGIEY